MELLRLPPYPLTTTWNLPDPNYPYIVYLEDLVDHSITEQTVSSDIDGVLVFELPLIQVQYDRQFLIRFYDSDHEHIIYEENLDVIRPYVNPADISTNEEEYDEAKIYEMVARSIIDTYVSDDFHNHKLVVQSVGQGTDYFSMWHPANRVLKVYENNVLVYDIEHPELYPQHFSISLDSTSVIRTEPDIINRAEQAYLELPSSSGDLMYGGARSAVFPRGYDYIFILDVGYKTVPADVEYATKLLISDMKCGKLDYYQRYATSYSTDQFRIQFDKSIINGTGNMLVDRILDKYVTTIVKPGIL